MAARGRELHGIRKEVPYHLLETIDVPGEGCRELFEVRLHVHALRHGRRPHRFYGRLDDAHEIDLTDGQAEFPRDDAGDVEEVFDELRLCERVAFDRLERLLAAGRVEVARPEHLRPT